MKNTGNDAAHRKKAALDYLTGQIDIWNRTATKKKKIITSWRRRVFVLVLVGTFCGLLSQSLSTQEGMDIAHHLDIHEMLAIASAIAIALSSFAGTQILTSDLEKSQIKARSTAEALKVQAFLYLMSAPPFNRKNAESLLYERIERILKEVGNITPELENKPNTKSFKFQFLNLLSFGRLSRELKKGVWVQRFDVDMTFDEYIEERVNGQINGYYLKKAAEFQSVINRGNSLCLIFGFLGVGIGTVAATTSPGASMWIAFLSTAAASIGSYLHANKYEYLMLSYVSTANQLELIAAKHKSLVNPTERMRRKFVAETESIFAMEHNAWISEISGVSDDDLLEDEEVETEIKELVTVEEIVLPERKIEP